VPFYSATSTEFEPPPEKTVVAKPEVKKTEPEKRKLTIATGEAFQMASKFAERALKLERNSLLILLGSLVGLYVFIRIIRRIFGGRKGKDDNKDKRKKAKASKEEQAAANALDSIKNVSEKSPEKIASLIKKWLVEED
jgi:flagellar biosynthesis/type III secretory pathway M-ring protein FliF/YscJ